MSYIFNRTLTLSSIVLSGIVSIALISSPMTPYTTQSVSIYSTNSSFAAVPVVDGIINYLTGDTDDRNDTSPKEQDATVPGVSVPQVNNTQPADQTESTTILGNTSKDQAANNSEGQALPSATTSSRPNTLQPLRTNVTSLASSPAASMSSLDRAARIDTGLYEPRAPFFDATQSFVATIGAILASLAGAVMLALGLFPVPITISTLLTRN